MTELTNPDGGAAAGVEMGIEQSRAYVSQVSEAFQDRIEEFNELIRERYIPNFNSQVQIIQYLLELDDLTSIVSAFDKPVAPEKPIDYATFPTAPGTESLGSVATITIDEIPQFTSTEPNIRDISAPSKLTQTVPASPNLPDRSNSIPATPEKNLPDPVVLRNLTLPDAPSTISFDFEGALPAELEPAPDVTFNYSESNYTSPLLTEVNSKLLSLVQNLQSTGLNPDIEDQIWFRSRERVNAVVDNEITQITRMWSASGWDEPAGDEMDAVARAVERAGDEDIAESRNIAIEQAKLELTNLQFAISQAIVQEGQLINHFDVQNARLLEASKYAIQAAIDLYGLKVAYHNAGIELYKAQASVYRDRLQAEITKVEIFKAQLEGQKLIGDLNAQDIANYRAQVDSVIALFELYKSELEGVKILLEQDGLKLQQYESEIRGFAETVRAKSLEYEGFRSELEGENIKVRNFEALSGAYRNRLDGTKTLIEARKIKQDGDIRVLQELPLERMKILAEKFKTETDAAAAKARSISDQYSTEADVFRTESDAEARRVEAEVKVQEAEIKYITEKAAHNLDVYKAHMAELFKHLDRAYDDEYKMRDIYAQLMASFASMVNYSAGISNTSGVHNQNYNNINDI